MAKFLAVGELSHAIKSILHGSDVRCAVAFWGEGADDLFQASASQARIVCDVTLGGTSPKALRKLGAPESDTLRHVPGLHAKVYISDRGAIVASANASRNGIGFEDLAGLVEAGVELRPDDEAFADAAVWFESIWASSKQVDKSALELAETLFRPGSGSKARAVRAGSLLALIVADPDRFAELSIVLTQSGSTAEERTRARSAVAAAHPGHADAVGAMPASGMFINWKRRDIDRWRRTFIEFWMPSNRLHCYGRKAVFFDDATGTVMSRLRWSSVRRVVEGDLPSSAEIAKNDETMIRKLLDRHGDKLFSPRELAAAIEANTS